MEGNSSKLKEELNNYLIEQRGEMARFLLALVNQNSGTFNKSGVDRVGQFIRENLEGNGLKVKIKRHKKFGDLLCFESRVNKDLPRLLISGHTDTVFEPLPKPVKAEIRGDVLYGPGSCDMKGGLAIAIYALKFLKSIGRLYNVDFILTPDEEQGSMAFRNFQERCYHKYDYALVLEGAGQRMEVCVERKGVGRVTLEVFGQAGHSGHKNTQTANAIAELCQKVVKILALIREDVGTTINAGIVSGGEKLNVVASYARAEFDVRYFDLAEMERIKTGLEAIEKETIIKGTKTKIKLEAFSPPMVASVRSLKLLKLARKVNLEWLGKKLGVARRGGGSDGNVISQQGVGVLDGLGILGRRIHTSAEEVYLPSIRDRILLLVGVILRCQDSG